MLLPEARLTKRLGGHQIKMPRQMLSKCLLDTSRLRISCLHLPDLQWTNVGA